MARQNNDIKLKWSHDIHDDVYTTQQIQTKFTTGWEHLLSEYPPQHYYMVGVIETEADILTPFRVTIEIRIGINATVSVIHLGNESRFDAAQTLTADYIRQYMVE